MLPIRFIIPTSRMEETAKSMSMLFNFLPFGSFFSDSLMPPDEGDEGEDCEDDGTAPPIVIGDGLEDRWFSPAYNEGYIEAAIECKEPIGGGGGWWGGPCGGPWGGNRA